MPTFRVDYSYYTNIKYDSFYVEGKDLIDAENTAESMLSTLDVVNPMIDVIEEMKVLA